MATLFELAAECEDTEAAEAVARHFDGFEVHDGVSARSCAARAFSIGDAAWMRAVPRGFGQSGCTSEEDARRMTAAGRALYARLESAPPYRFAIVGVEVEGVRSIEELEGDGADLPGLVLARSLWVDLGCPEGFEPFAEGYVWRPWPGQTSEG